VKTLSKLKKELDKWFSLYIRLRYASVDGIIKCFTCDKVSHYKKGMHAGHFMSRRFLSTRWNEDNVQNQCVKCNIFDSGQQYAFGKLLDVRVGDGTSEELQELSRTTVKYMRHEYDDMIKFYKEKVNAIKTD
tara:strand:+ start:382 stop:777 length:396 start_codon:yes stop_codon:yes gene_type:complete